MWIRMPGSLGFLFARTSSQKILQLNHQLLLFVDCMYKTDAHKIKSLCIDIINGVTPTNTTFYMAFCFLSSKTTDDYKWLLKTIKDYCIITMTQISRSHCHRIRWGPWCWSALSFIRSLQHIFYVYGTSTQKIIVVNCKPWIDDEDELVVSTGRE